jgi:hypothetical protein
MYNNTTQDIPIIKFNSDSQKFTGTKILYAYKTIHLYNYHMHK